MDIQRLKLLAGRVRVLLQKSNHTVGYNQSLDLIAALPGLRNWPEVQAFPDRVADCDLDGAAASRLAFRFKRKFDLELSPNAILMALGAPGGKSEQGGPHIWPTGPAPGVYITMSPTAIDAFLFRYDDATDGGVVYAERAGIHWGGSIDLGENGLWSGGLERVPSGTLVIVGPVELNQQAWVDSASKLETACLLALNDELRVVVLIDTASPEGMWEDVRLMLRSSQPSGEDYDKALIGFVTDDGECHRVESSAGPRPNPAPIRSVATVDAIPLTILPALRKAVARRATGLLLFGSALHAEHPAIELVAASLALTEHAGPAARIRPRNRSTPAKDWQVPEAIQQLPFLPSIESAYDQGYRRMIYDPSYTRSDLLLKFSEKVLLIAGTYASDVMDAYMSTMRAGGTAKDGDLFARIIAILGVTAVPTKQGEVMASDFFVALEKSDVHPNSFEEIEAFLRKNRILKSEDELGQLLDLGVVKVSALKKALPRSRVVQGLLSERTTQKKKAIQAH